MEPNPQTNNHEYNPFTQNIKLYQGINIIPEESATIEGQINHRLNQLRTLVQGIRTTR